MSGRGRGGKSTTAPPSVASSISFGAAALSPSALGPPTRFPVQISSIPESSYVVAKPDA